MKAVARWLGWLTLAWAVLTWPAHLGVMVQTGSLPPGKCIAPLATLFGVFVFGVSGLLGIVSAGLGLWLRSWFAVAAGAVAVLVALSIFRFWML